MAGLFCLVNRSARKKEVEQVIQGEHIFSFPKNLTLSWLRAYLILAHPEPLERFGEDKMGDLAIIVKGDAIF